MPLLLPFALALLAGAVLPLQAVMNARMGQLLQHPALASLLSFVVGAAALCAYLVVDRHALPPLSVLREASASWWLAGVLGAFYVTAVVWLTPRLGVALTFGLIVAGQMALSLLFDRYGWMGMPIRELNATRVLGALLLVAGVVLIHKG